MNSRERVLSALEHRQPDRIPFDLGSTQVTGISAEAYMRVARSSGLPEETPELCDSIQQLAMPSEDFLKAMKVDTRGLFPLTSHNWNVEAQLTDTGTSREYRDEWGIVHHRPKDGGHWFSLLRSPFEDIEPSVGAIRNHAWPDAGDRRRVAGLRDKAVEYRKQGKAVVLKGLCAGIFEMLQRLRGMENALMDIMLNPGFADQLLGKIADLKIEFWEMALDELHDVVDVVAEMDDYGTQTSQLVSPEQFRDIFKPHLKRILDAIRQKAPNARIFFHSCGSVRPIIPDFIEMGVDILNPVHISAAGMEPTGLKRDFGDAITFWGGGVDTQDVLPKGTPGQVADHVKRNIDALSPGGGFVFATVHNIQSEVPTENIMAMWNALQEYSA